MWTSLLATEPVPAPLPLITVLHVLTLTLHWVVMNALVACAWHLATARASDLPLQKRMAGVIPSMFAITVTLGVAPLLFLQLIHGERFYASSVFMAWPWVGALVVLMLGYCAAYTCDGRARKGLAAPGWMRWLPFVSLASFAFVLTANVALSELPAVLDGLTEAGWAMAIFETDTLPRYLHHFIGAVSLGSVWLAISGYRVRQNDPERGAAIMKRGAMACMIGTIIAVVFGMWQLVAAPKEIGGAIPGASLGLGILAGLAVPGFMALAWKHGDWKWVRLSVIAVVVTVLCKTVLRQAIKVKRLDAGGDIPAPDTATQAGPIILVVVGVIVAVAAVGWLVRRARSARDDGSEA